MNKKIIGASALLATGLVAGGLFSVGSIANAADSSSNTVAASTDLGTPPSFGGDQGRPPHIEVTGDALAKLTDATTAKYAGATVLRAEQMPDGNFVVHAKLTDGSIKTLEFDANYNITATLDGFGKGGPRGGEGKDPFSSNSVRDDEKLVTGDVAAKLTAAAEAKVPGATVIRAEEDADGSVYEVHMKKADGSAVTVKFDADYNITGVEEGFGPGPKGPHGPKGDHGPRGNRDGDGPAFTLPSPVPSAGSNN